MYFLVYSEEPMTQPKQFVRIDELDALHVRPKGEGQRMALVKDTA